MRSENLNSGDVTLRKGERAILAVLASAPVKRTRAQLATLAGFTASGGTYQAYVGTLKRAGLIEIDGDEVTATDAGRDYVGDAHQAPRTTEDVVAMWKRALRKGERDMLDALLAGERSRDELAEAVGMTASGGTFQAYLGTLRRNGLAEVSGDVIRAGRVLFEVAG